MIVAMAMFHVFVEGPKDRSAGAIERLADALAENYGLPAPELVSRLKRGRFRVKANLDRDSADNFARSLEQLGARVAVEDSTLSTATPATGTPVVPRTMSSLPARAATSPGGVKPQYQSGLSAAFSSEPGASGNLGALESGSMSLASLDGEEPAKPPKVTFGRPSTEPGGSLPASFGPAPERPTPDPAGPASKPRAATAPVDLFAPPDAETASDKLDLAVDEVAHRARRSQDLPVPTAPAAAPPARTSEPKLSPGAMTAQAAQAAMPRGRFAAGVFLAILIGFVPAHAFASYRQHSVYRAIDADIERTQAAATSPESYEALDGFRATQLERKKSERTTIALTSLVIWAAAGAGLAYVWFRRLPWERIARA